MHIPFFSIYFLKFIFNWRIIPLQYCTGFCHTTTWISCKYAYIPFLLNLTPTPHTIPLLRDVTELQVELPVLYFPFSSVQSLSRVWLFATPCTVARQASQPITNSRNLLKLMSFKSVMPSNHLILCHPLLLPHSIFPSIRVFSNESVLCIRWSKYCFNFSISSSNEYSGLISFKIDWFDLLAVQGTLKSLLQHHSSKASVLRCSAFFMAQLSHPYMATGKTIALTRRTFVGKVMSLLFNMLSRFVIAFLQRSKHLLISWLQSPYGVILEPKKIKLVTVSIVSHLFAIKWWDQIQCS